MDPATNLLATQFQIFCIQNNYGDPSAAIIQTELQKQIHEIYNFMCIIDKGERRPYMHPFPGIYLAQTTQCSDLKIAEFATKLLLGNGFEVNDIVNARQKTALDQIAENKERLPIMKLLLLNGARLSTNLNKQCQENLINATLSLDKGT